MNSMQSHVGVWLLLARSFARSWIQYVHAFVNSMVSHVVVWLASLLTLLLGCALSPPAVCVTPKGEFITESQVPFSRGDQCVCARGDQCVRARANVSIPWEAMKRVQEKAFTRARFLFLFRFCYCFYFCFCFCFYSCFYVQSVEEKRVYKHAHETHKSL
jgi:hypothetical protein